MSETCAHPAAVEGFCRECGFCLHEVILNGVCMACESDDLAVTIKPDEPSNVVPLHALTRKPKED